MDVVPVLAMIQITGLNYQKDREGRYLFLKHVNKCKFHKELQAFITFHTLLLTHSYHSYQEAIDILYTSNTFTVSYPTTIEFLPSPYYPNVSTRSATYGFPGISGAHLH